MSLRQIAWSSLKLGLTSFGGPVAHLGFFRHEYVTKQKWLSEEEYADIVALAQFLPGPASSQVGMAIGYQRGGHLGAILAWFCFTMPSIALLLVAALSAQWFPAEIVVGLKLVAVAVVADAVLSMGQKLVTTKWTTAFMLLALALTLLLPYGAVISIAISAVVMIVRSKERTIQLNVPRSSVVLLGSFTALLLASFVTYHASLVALFAQVFQAGALVFGGGHVVLPLLKEVFVPDSMTSDQFLLGYSLAQAVPGPLFTLVSFLGFVAQSWLGALVATVAIFVPAYLLMIGTMPIWHGMKQYAVAKAAMEGMNAAVVGVLAAALYDPIWQTSIHEAWQFIVAISLVALMRVWHVKPLYLVIATIAIAFVIHFVQ